MSKYPRVVPVRESICAQLGFELSESVISELDFALEGALCADRPWNLALAIRAGDARLVLRSELIKEFRAGGHRDLIKRLDEVPGSELAVCIFRGSNAPRLGTVRLEGLKVPRRVGGPTTRNRSTL